MNLQKLKERLAPSIETWIDARIDDMIKGNPSLAIPSVYMKRAAHNIVCRNKENGKRKLTIYPCLSLMKMELLMRNLFSKTRCKY